MNTIYAGKAPIYRLGAHQFRLLEFAPRYPGWHTVGRDRMARRALASLVRRRLVETVGDQFRFLDTRP